MKKLATAIAVFALIGTPAFAADMAVKAPPPPPPAPVYSWTGFYVGLNVGWGWGNDNTTVNFPGPVITSAFAFSPPIPAAGFACIGGCFELPIVNQETTHPMGAIGGVQFGYNWQANSNWILGFETDFQASGESTTGNAHQTEQNLVVITAGPLFAETSASQSISHNDALLWFGTVRGRVGYAIWPTVMLYGTGGLAYGRLNESVSASFNGFCTTNNVSCSGGIGLNGVVLPANQLAVPFSVGQNFDSSVTKTGWTVGGGIEGVVPNTHITWKAEYLYMDLGTENFAFSGGPILGTITLNTHFTDNIVRVGLNYQFH